MNKEEERYNNTRARYIAMLIMQNRYNKNRGIAYGQAVKENSRIKADIDFWLSVLEG